MAGGEDCSVARRACIIGLGNPLLQDEGFGVHTLRYLAGIRLPRRISLVDGGTAGYDLLPYMGAAKRLVFIDALRAGGEPGRVYRLSAGDLSAGGDLPLSPHQVDLQQTIALARALRMEPEITIYGVQPKNLGWGLELSPELRTAVPIVARLALREFI